MTTTRPFKAGSILLLAGTKQGLFLISSEDRQHWQITKTPLGKRSSYVYYAIFDPRKDYRLFATDNGPASSLCYSDDFGQSWQEPARGIQFLQGFTLKDIWYIEPGPMSEPETVYAGTDPACLWESHDSGESWTINEALLTYPGRDRWGASLVGTCLHSIIRDFAQSQRLWVSISGAGTLRSTDAGRSWQVQNTMVASEQKGTGVGTNSHRLLQHPKKADILYQQSKNGIFRSDDGGESWKSILSNLPTDFGFPLALDQHYPETLFTVMLDPEDRYTPGEQFAVYRTETAGQQWEALTTGLPRKRMKVLRHALCTDAKAICGVYVGTMSGELFASNNRGENWQMLSDQLPPIYSLTAVEYN
jgi:photosystem II stability/assembly factor-like uncharacterized protein